MAGEKLGFDKALQADDESVVLNGLAEHMRNMAGYRRGVDSIVRPYCIGISEAIIEEKDFGNLLYDAFKRRVARDRNPFTYRTAAEFVLRDFQSLLIQGRVPELGPYAEKPFQSRSTWRNLPRRLFFDNRDEPLSEQNREEFTLNIMMRNTQSNLASRYISHSLLIDTLQDRLGAEPSVLDIGASIMLGLIKLKHTESHFQLVEVSGAPWNMTKHGLSHRINKGLEHRAPIGPSWGMDVFSLDPPTRAWAEACTFRGKEWSNKMRRKEWKDLHDWVEASRNGEMGLSFFEGDITSESDVAGLAEVTPKEKFKIVSMTTMLYQLTKPGEREKARQHARSFLADDGIIIYQDFCQRISEESTELDFFDDWPPFGYRTYVELAEEPGRLYEFIKWENGRCKRMKAGADYAALAELAA